MKKNINFVMILVMILNLFISMPNMVSASISTPGLSSDLTPQYGENEKFLASIDRVDTVPDGYTGIWTKQDLDDIRNNQFGDYILMDDIVFEPEDFEIEGEYYNDGMGWKPIESFYGNFDGQGHVIHNLRITGDSEFNGLFGYIGSAAIKNVGLEGTYINITASFAYAGGICGEVNSSSIISNCYNIGYMSVSGGIAGGICGNARGTITNCYNTEDVFVGSDYAYTLAGGIFGSGSDISISNCFNTGNVSAAASAAVGGIFGAVSNFNISNCYNTGDVTSYGGIAGGICADGYGIIANCYNIGNVTSDFESSFVYAGGICGSFSNQSSIVDCYNTGNISASSGALSTSSSYDAGAYAGGIYGNGLAAVTNCYNVGDISASSDSVYSASDAGGIYGYGFGDILYCYNMGNVSASTTASDSNANAGGIVGSGSGSSISDCYNTGEVIAFSDDSWWAYASAGGICAGFDGYISDCYNIGSVSAHSNSRSVSVGGICGSGYSYNPIDSGINNCYNTGDIYAYSAYSSADAGGICGDINGSVSNCYWNIESKQIINDSASNKKGIALGTDTTTPLNNAQMKNEISFDGFDFIDVWDIVTGVNKGYPILKGLLYPQPDIDPEIEILGYNGVSATLLSNVAVPSAVLIIVGYEGDMLMSLNQLPCSLTKGTSSIPLICPQTQKVKILLWEKLVNLKPLAEEYTYFPSLGSEDGFEFDAETGTITGYIGAGGDVTIPSVIDGVNVSIIGFGAFQENTSITNVSIPESVEKIDFYAFADCTKLQGVIISNSVTEIWGRAFYNCEKLDNLTIGENVRYIGNYAFSLCVALTDIELPDSLQEIRTAAFKSCDGLANITIPKNVAIIENGAFSVCDSLMEINVVDDNPYFTGVDGVLFSKDKTVLYQYPSGNKFWAYSVPKTVNEIYAWAFDSCENLTFIEFGELRKIDMYAFNNCTGLTYLTLPSGVEHIEYSAFTDCSNLERIIIPESVTNMGIDTWGNHHSVFEGCDNLTIVGVENSTAHMHAIEFNIPFVEGI